MKIKTYFCSITMNRWYQYEEVVKNIYPYVDHIICIDGGSKDGTIEGLRKLSGYNYYQSDWDDFKDGVYDIDYNAYPLYELSDYKLFIINKKWTDNFPEQRQSYLDVIKDIREEDEISWVCVADSDEYYSERLRKGLKDLCKYATEKGYDCIGIRSKGITYNENKEVSNLTYDDFWKPLVYRYDPGRRIIGTSPDGSEHNVHEGFSKPFNKFLQLPSKHEDGVENELVYEHRKDVGDVWQRGHARNFYAGGGGPNLGELQPLWKPFRKLVEECMIEDGWNKPETWWDYDSYLKKGNVHNKLKEWMINHRLEGIKDRDFDKYPLSDAEEYFLRTKNKIDYDGSSEVRELFLYFYGFLHRDQLIELDEEIVLNSPLNQSIKDCYLNEKVRR